MVGTKHKFCGCPYPPLSNNDMKSLIVENVTSNTFEFCMKDKSWFNDSCFEFLCDYPCALSIVKFNLHNTKISKEGIIQILESNVIGSFYRVPVKEPLVIIEAEIGGTPNANYFIDSEELYREFDFNRMNRGELEFIDRGYKQLILTIEGEVVNAVRG